MHETATRGNLAQQTGEAVHRLAKATEDTAYATTAQGGFHPAGTEAWTVRNALNAAIEEKQRELARLVHMRDNGPHEMLRMPLHQFHEFQGAI